RVLSRKRLELLERRLRRDLLHRELPLVDLKVVFEASAEKFPHVLGRTRFFRKLDEGGEAENAARQRLRLFQYVDVLYNVRGRRVRITKHVGPEPLREQVVVLRLRRPPGEP